MKLCLDDEDDRPSQLTPDFFISLMITETKRKATLQLLEFHKKKELTYSTKISDGFFIVKVMLIHKAAEQLDNGLIQLNYLIEGYLRNHGEGVIMIRQPLRFWKYDRKVGNPVSWRLNRENVNSKGFNFIVWNSQQLPQLHQLHDQSPRQLHKTNEGKSKSKNQSKSKSKHRMRQEQHHGQAVQDKFYQLPSHRKSNTKAPINSDLPISKNSKVVAADTEPARVYSLSQTQTQSLNMQKTKQSKLPIVQTNKPQKAESSNPPYKQINPKFQEGKQGSKFTKMTKSIIQLILAEQEDTPLSTNQMPYKKIQQASQKQKQEPVINLKFIFDILDSDQEEQAKKCYSEQPKVQEEKYVEQQSSDEEFTNWLQSKKIAQTTAIEPVTKQQLQSSYEKKRQFYKNLLDSSESQTQVEIKQSKSNPLPVIPTRSLLEPIPIRKTRLDNTSSQHINYNKQTQINNQKPLQINNQHKQQVVTDHSYITFSDIYHGLSAKNNPNWWTKALLCCLGPPTPKDYAHAILTDQSGHQMISVSFTNLSQSKQQLIQSKLYKLGKGLIKLNSQNIHRNVSHSELEFDCKKATIQLLDSDQIPTYRSQNYHQLNQIYEMEDEVRVHTFGVIKALRNTSSKNGVISHYEIVDPIVKYSLGFTQFDSQLTVEDIQGLLNLPICIYNGYISSYRGRKNVVSRPKTIVKYNWLPSIRESRMIWQWMENEGNRIEEIDINLVGYVECESLDRIISVNDGRVFVRNVVVLDINDKFTYLACVKCYKKVEDGRCRTCGRRNHKEIVERLLVRGNIGDYSNVLGVLWSNQLAQMLVRQGLQKFKSSWLLKRVSVWLQRGSNEGYTIVKMKELQPQVRIKSLLAFISTNIL